MPSSAGQKCALRSEEHTSELQSHDNLVCRLLLDKKDQSFPDRITAKDGARLRGVREDGSRCDATTPAQVPVVSDSARVFFFKKGGAQSHIMFSQQAAFLY